MRCVAQGLGVQIETGDLNLEIHLYAVVIYISGKVKTCASYTYIGEEIAPYDYTNIIS